ncbi:hypothetical protein ACR56S_04225 [Staphylococcus hominis]|uniref:hypothetical protein n=1 Tax=Staphylococcus hominis TaxID=1290 RepID=UPI003DA02D61
MELTKQVHDYIENRIVDATQSSEAFDSYFSQKVPEDYMDKIYHVLENNGGYNLDNVNDEDLMKVTNTMTLILPNAYVDKIADAMDIETFNDIEELNQSLTDEKIYEVVTNDAHSILISLDNMMPPETWNKQFATYDMLKKHFIESLQSKDVDRFLHEHIDVMADDIVEAYKEDFGVDKVDINDIDFNVVYIRKADIDEVTETYLHDFIESGLKASDFVRSDDFIASLIANNQLEFPLNIEPISDNTLKKERIEDYVNEYFDEEIYEEIVREMYEETIVSIINDEVQSITDGEHSLYATLKDIDRDNINYLIRFYDVLEADELVDYLVEYYDFEDDNQLKSYLQSERFHIDAAKHRIADFAIDVPMAKYEFEEE